MEQSQHFQVTDGQRTTTKTRRTRTDVQQDGLTEDDDDGTDGQRTTMTDGRGGWTEDTYTIYSQAVQFEEYI